MKSLQGKTTKPKVGVLSRNRVYRDNLARLIGKAADVACSACSRDAAWLSGRVDVILLDAHDADAAVLSELVKRAPATRLVITNADWDRLDLIQCARFGVVAYILADAEAKELLAVIHGVQAGIEIISPAQITVRLHKQLALQHRNGPGTGMDAELSAREREVLHCILDGFSNKGISAKLNISEPTVKNHVHHILLKLNCRRRGELFRRYFGSARAAG